MARELPDKLKGLTEAEKEERRDQLVEESRKTRRELESEQEEFLDSLQEEHGGDLVETKTTLPGGNIAHIEVNLNGELMDRMSHMDSKLADLENPGPGDLENIGTAMDEASQILADITVEAKFSKTVFYEVYRRYGPEALGEHIEAVFDAIEKEMKRKQGAVDGFR